MDGHASVLLMSFIVSSVDNGDLLGVVVVEVEDDDEGDEQEELVDDAVEVV